MAASDASNEELQPLYVLSPPPPAPATSIPSSGSSPPASVHSTQSTHSVHSEQPSHHPVLDSQTEYYNLAFPPPSTPEPPSEMSYSTPNSDYSYAPAGTPQQTITIAEVNSMIQSLRSRRVNTLTELRRIERTLAVLPAFSTEYIVNMTDAWNNYVNCNNFLNELRGLTRRYPFSAELLEEAKQRVINDANSSRSWNFAWLLLVKMRNEYASYRGSMLIDY
jgi:hypothetical protein